MSDNMPSGTYHYHYHYHYYYPVVSPEAAAVAPMDDDVEEEESSGQSNSQPTTDSGVTIMDDEADTEDDDEVDAYGSDAGYVRQGIEILDKDKGILTSYGYYDVAKQTVKYRRLMLMEATQYLSKDYIQERLYFIAKVQSRDQAKPFLDDLAWFEETYRLAPYIESTPEPEESVGSYH